MKISDVNRVKCKYKKAQVQFYLIITLVCVVDIVVAETLFAKPMLQSSFHFTRFVYKWMIFRFVPKETVIVNITFRGFAIYFGFALSIVFEVRLKEDFMRETRKNDKQKRSRLSICERKIKKNFDQSCWR